MNLIGNINAIPFRRFRGGGGVSPIPPFPSIPGMIARYSALGLTNEQMATNPVWVDKTGNDHDLQMKNFAWGGMSGVGGYKQDYKGNRWTYASSRADIFYTGNFINVTSVKINSVQLYYQAYGGQPSFTVPSYSVKVSGLVEGQNLDYRSSNGLILNIKEDGIYRLPEFEFSANGGFYGFQLNKIQESCNITIEQLPLYPGALVFDGVDDYGVCENFPILTKEKGYTVVALRQWISKDEGLCGLVSNVRSWFEDGTFVLEYFYRKNLHSISFGAIKSEKDLPHILTYQTSKSYNGVSITPGSFKGTDVLHVGGLAPINVGNYANAAIWELVFLDHDATEEELTKIKDYFVKTYPWLFPDQAWTVTGKTNEDEDRATIANITGNGNDLVCLNLGFIEGSGYNEEGEYAGYLVTDGVDDKITSSTFEMGNDWTVIGDWELINTGKNDNAGIVKFNSIVIYNYNPILINIKNGRNNLIPDQNTVNAICSDGRIYSKDWKESIYNEETESTSKNLLTIGYSGGVYTKIAFKNLAIYPTVLSKDDCIKAYNYLQTLKAK